MTKKKNLFIFSIILIVIIAVVIPSPNSEIDNRERKKNITLIVKMKGGNYWNTVRLGAEAAAKEYNAGVSFVAADSERDVKEQIKLVEGAIDNKVDAIILAASDYKELSTFVDKANSNNIPVITIDTEVDSKNARSFIGTDNIKAGEKAGEALVSSSGVDCKIAVMSFVKGSKNAEQREKGLNDVILKYPSIKVVAKEYCQSDADTAAALTRKIISEHKDLNAIVALNEVAAIGVSKAIDDMNLEGKVKVVGFDNAPEEIKLLEGGVIQAIVIQNPFSMGYFGVKYAVEAVEGKKIPKSVDTGVKVINKENLYLPDNQKLVFPFIK